jgi:hypothetical protein
MEDVEVCDSGDGGMLPRMARWPLIYARRVKFRLSGWGGPKIKFDDVDDSSFGEGFAGM